MRIKASKDDICEVFFGSFDMFCKDMDWEPFTPPSADFVHEGWRVSIENEVADGVFAAASRPWRRMTSNRHAKMDQRYTPSLRDYGKTCSECVFREGDKCSIGGFKVKSGGGCEKFKKP